MPNILKELRQSRKETQSQVAKNLNMPQTSYQKYETTDINSISSSTLLKFADYYGVSTEHLFGRNTKKGIKIPVFGNIPAGIPIEVLDEIIDEEEISQDMASRGEYFCLRVSGDSMQPIILNKDIALIRKQDDCETNDIVAVHINGDGATLKKIKKEEEGMRLIPLNQEYKPMFYKWKDVEDLPIKIIGKLVETRRKFY